MEILQNHNLFPSVSEAAEAVNHVFIWFFEENMQIICLLQGDRKIKGNICSLSRYNFCLSCFTFFTSNPSSDKPIQGPRRVWKICWRQLLSASPYCRLDELA